MVCTLAFGANQPSHVGDPRATVALAFEALAEGGLTLVSRSAMFRTPAFPAGMGPDYVNAVGVFETQLAAREVLALCHATEARFGRTRDIRWGSRCLDIDLLDHGGAVWPDADTYARWQALPLEAQIGATPEQLILPHPRIADRGFVLVPLADAAPEWIHPVTGRSVAQMIAALPPDAVNDVVKL